MIMGILRVPPLAGESCWCCVYGPSVTTSSALVTLGCFHHITFRGVFCKRVERWVDREKDGFKPSEALMMLNMKI